MRPIEILMVEDNPGDVELTREYFAELKVANVLNVVGTGEEALAYLQSGSERRPDLILLDLNLPGRSGREILEQVKSDPEFAAIPVVVLTSSQAEQDILRSYQLHANAYITKPVDIDGFATIVQSIQDFWFSVVRLPPRA